MPKAVQQPCLQVLWRFSGQSTLCSEGREPQGTAKESVLVFHFEPGFFSPLFFFFFFALSLEPSPQSVSADVSISFPSTPAQPCTRKQLPKKIATRTLKKVLWVDSKNRVFVSVQNDVSYYERDGRKAKRSNDWYWRTGSLGSLCCFRLFILSSRWRASGDSGVLYQKPVGDLVFVCLLTLAQWKWC